MGMMFPMTKSLLNDPKVWIGDTGATMHMTPYSLGMMDLHDTHAQEAITMGNKSVEQAMKIGNMPGKISDKHSNSWGTTTIKDVALVSKCGFNLFSISNLLKEDWHLKGTSENLTLTKDGHTIVFDKCILTPRVQRGITYMLYIKHHTEMAGMVIDGKIQLTIQQAHDQLGHCSDETT